MISVQRHVRWIMETVTLVGGERIILFIENVIYIK